ncbi:dehydrogenase/reductase SDR family member 1 [Syngnathus acus]|uniref:dehydrogenase/reductase SDR family member 1 n=1 Tax=Syngnathus acus TaxID=161584 RepID=UPI001885DEB9|nr:dehydrogenase/reductase SDR family member 1 [Syngnathus acus]XP_037131937.1 dehydrogenase/reductase SDR family member 1 [Syngnathus acus]XP_037131938.1 dehydrogenase/reductase SDR family member 1 [Syngnathus acus]
MSLSGWICVVTGASRGIGKGIALQLCEAGATVYITGRKEAPLNETATQVNQRGGKCVPVICDSTNDSDIEKLFERIKLEQSGRLDLLVNNAYAGVQTIFENQGKKFWETEPSMWDTINNTGLRSHYICSVYAARMMVAQGQGLIITISSMGGVRYLFNVPYGVGKAACDRMAADMALELRKSGVASISLWPGPVKTEIIEEMVLSDDSQQKTKDVFVNGETTEFSGLCIVNLAQDKNLMSLSGKILMTCELARRYGLRDFNGRSVEDFTSVKFLLTQVPRLSWLSYVVPSFIRIPRSMLSMGSTNV